MLNGVSRTLLLIFVLILAWIVGLSAAPPTREVAEKLRQEGKLQEWTELWESAAQRGMYDPNPAFALRLAKRSTGDVDTLRPLVICVEFTDNSHSYNTDTLEWLLFSRGFSVPTGSFRDYYQENSYGQHDPQGGVYGWVSAPQPYTYYTNYQYGLGSYPRNAQGLVENVLAAVDPYLNFQDYDYDGDGYLDGLMIVHAGPGAEETGNVGHIWSHRWSITQQIRDNVKINSYTMQPEKHGGGGLIDIGVFCHEWGHDLGILWEEYDTDYSSDGLGDWSVMAIGCFNDDGKSPAHHSAYCKYVLGWTDVVNVTSNMTDVEILQAETSPVTYRLWSSGSMGDRYFLVENRQKTSFDSHLPGEGLLIYHVDQTKGTNDLEWCPGDAASNHFKVALEQADGRFTLEGCNDSPNGGDGNDPFPGSWNKRAFDDTTTPGSRDYDDDVTQVAVWNISDSDSAMYANFDVTWSRPNLALESFSLDDNSGGDGDGRAEPGETVKLYFSLSNTWKSLSGSWVTASADTEGIDFSVDSVYLGDILSGHTVDNSGNPLQFSVAAGFPSKMVDLNFHICGDGGSYCTDRTQSASIGPPEILLVDDDNHVSGDSNYAPLYQKSLDALGLIYDTWDKTADPESTVYFSPYQVVIWFTGNQREDILPGPDVQNLKDYLDAGGRLFLTSQDAVQKLSTSGSQDDSTFLADYLHVSYGGVRIEPLAMGVSDDPVGGDVYLYLGGYYAPDNQESKDILIPDSCASPILNYADIWFVAKDSVAGIKYEADFKVVLFGFGFEAIDSTGRTLYGHELSQPIPVMDKVLDWLQAPSRIGSIALDAPEYFGTEDSLVATVSDPDLNLNPEEVDTVSIRVASNTDQVGLSILCTETDVSSGVFSGSCGFINGTTDDVNDSLSVSDGDTVLATYADLSPPGDRTAKAMWWAQQPDLDPPAFTVGVMQNPVFSAELEIYAIPSESLQAAPNITLGTTALEVNQVSYNGTVIYSSHHTLTGAGNIQIQVSGMDCAGNVGYHTEVFAAGKILPAGGSAASHDGVLHLGVGRGAVDKEEFFLVFASDGQSGEAQQSNSRVQTQYPVSFDWTWRKPTGGDVWAAYRLTPLDFKLKSEAELSFDYGGFESGGEDDPAFLTIERLEGEAWISVPSYVDRNGQRILTFVDQLGAYRLKYGDDHISNNIPAAYSLFDNYPNPFNNSTLIGYETPSPGPVRVEIYNVLGQRVRILVDEYRSPGRHTIEWDGLNQRQENVSSGIYFYRLSAEGFSQTKKMIFLK